MKKKRVNKKPIVKRKKLLVVMFFVFIGALYLIYNFLKLSVIDGEKYRKMALQSWTRTYETRNVRGLIYDRDRVKLAINKPAYTLWIVPENFSVLLPKDKKIGLSEEKVKDKEAEIKNEAIETLSEYSSMSKDEIKDIIEKNKRKKLVQWLTDEQKEKINSYFELGLKGLEVEEKYKRFYPDGKLYNHILGFTDIDQNGLTGVELTLNDSLFGKPEFVIKLADGTNQPIPHQYIKTFGGEGHGDVVLTISDKIQRVVDREALRAKEENNAKSVSIIVMDPMNGDILAMTDTNKYDNNKPKEPVNKEQEDEWKDKTDEEMVSEWQKNWDNLNVNALYEPGSTFKTVTLAAALEEGRVDDSTDLYCNGVVTDIPGVVLRCVRWQNPHGKLNIADAYAESCNVAFIQIARKLGKENFLKYIKAFGFGEKSGIDLNGEQKGIIPQEISDMTPVRLATASYGQGIADTNIQTCMAMSAAVNGGYLLRPRLIKEIRENDEVIKRFPVEVRRKVISEETSNKMREYMEHAVLLSNKQGKVLGYRVGGKSGTAMVPDKGKYLKDKYIASFCGIAPIDDPKVLVFVCVDQPGNGISYGGVIAGPVSSRIMKEILPLMGIPASLTKEEMEQETSYVIPEIMSMKLKDATKILRDTGIKFRISNEDVTENSIIIGVSPTVGSVINDKSIVTLDIRNIKDEEMVPDFIGRSIEECKELGKKRGLIVHISGNGYCVKQSISAGTFITDSITTVDLNFEPKEEKKDGTDGG